uniref:Uncharacterized protein n=1 Tax=Anopheles coluzzii TaxID=1518534 RepID=A0A8W7PG07_ANOCL
MATVADHAAAHPHRPVVDDLREVGKLRPDVVHRVLVDEGGRERILVVPVVDDVRVHRLLGEVEAEMADDRNVLAGPREAVRVAAVVVRVHAGPRVHLRQVLQLVVPVQLRHVVGRPVPGQRAEGEPLPLPVVLLQDHRLPLGRHRHELRLLALAGLAERQLRVAADVRIARRAHAPLAVVVARLGAMAGQQ